MIITVTLNPSLDEWIELPALRVGELNRASGFTRYPGGKGINVSRVVRELGGRTLALGVAGGEDGLILRQLLNRLAIPHTLVPIPGRTRNNYKIRTVRPPALTELNTAGPAVPAASLRQLARLLLRAAATARCVVCSGSLPPGVAAAVYAQWLRAARQRQCLTVLDASGEPLRRGLAARPWLIKPNRQEAETLVGFRLTTEARVVRAARELLARGPELAVVSMGEDGAMLACRATGEMWMARPPAVRVRSAVGAGDSLVAGFVVEWLRSRSPVEALRAGVACGSAAAMTPGTELCHRKDVRRLLPRVRIARLRSAG
ncbi:MAG: 1-phosphofructokinase [Candidatus Omnitrophica bacterium]|nr:1-phosphofructokinase [Candidatus Omnitrophota bacterium]